jgi:hypothetical protein
MLNAISFKYFHLVAYLNRKAHAINAVVERASSRGGTQLFVTSVARFYDSDDSLLALNRETTVYQPLGTG